MAAADISTDALPLVDRRNLHLADTESLRREFCFFFKTVQSTVVRTLVDAMKEVVADTNLIFDRDGLTIKAMDQPQNAMIHLRLRADRFEEYVCDGTHTCGVALLHLHRLLKTMSSTDVLMIYMRRKLLGAIDIHIENNKKAKTSHFRLYLLDLPKTSALRPIVPDPQYSISIESSELNKIVREMKDIAQNLDIRYHNRTLRFKAVNGTFAEASVFLGIKEDEDEGRALDDIVQGVFSLRYLSMFTKCTPLSKEATLFLKNDFPLIVQYNVSNMGVIQLVLMMEDDAGA